MSNVVEFLQQLGQNSQLRYAGQHELEQALNESEIAPSLRAALLNGDQLKLATLIGSPLNMVCAVFAPMDEEDEPEQEDEPSKEEKIGY